MFQAQNRETIEQYLKRCCILQDHYDVKRDKIVFHNTAPDLQDQDRFFWSQNGLVLRPMVSDHITGNHLTFRLAINMYKHPCTVFQRAQRLPNKRQTYINTDKNQQLHG